LLIGELTIQRLRKFSAVTDECRVAASTALNQGALMAMLAMAIPISPGKTDQWKKFVGELNGPRFEDFKASRRKLGVHERTFLQQTPMGDFVVVTIEGADPAGAFARFGQGTDDFTKWFLKQAQEIHGIDLTAPPPGPLPELVIDSGK